MDVWLMSAIHTGSSKIMWRLKQIVFFQHRQQSNCVHQSYWPVSRV